MKTNLLTTIKTAALTAGFKFIYGDGRYFEQGISQIDLTDGSLGLMFNIISARQVIEAKQWNGEIDYSVQFFLFRKVEMNTQSSLAETLEQKFENRMDEIENELLKFITKLTQCNNDIDLISPNMQVWTNRGSVNVDGWYLECTLKLNNQYPL